MGKSAVTGQNPIFHFEKDEVHIWRLEPEPVSDLSRYSALLSQDEQERAARFRFAHLTRNFIGDHGRMRVLLGAYTGLAPESLVYAVNEFGKPELANHGVCLYFNLSHTEGLSLLAICLDTPVGVDVEAVRAMDDWRDVAQSHFSQREIDALQLVAESDQQNAFFRCWTRKEAFLKAHGLGLSMALDSFTVSLDRESKPALLECTWNPEETRRWSLVSLDVAGKFVGALAIQGKHRKIRYFDWAKDRSLIAST